MRALLGALKENGLTRQAAERMRPYILRFVEDVESGKVSLEAPDESLPFGTAR